MDTKNWIPYLFSKQAQKTPHNISIISGNKEITFKELDSQSDKFASNLMEMGVSRGDFVGILQERSIDFVVSVIAILKTGGCCVPMDLEYPLERLNLIIEEANLPFIIKDKTFNLPTKKSTQIFNFADVLARRLPSKSLPNCSENDLAFIFFTSGSTGKPKGVMMSHKARVRSVQWLINNFEHCHTHLFKSSVTHNPMVREIFWPLLTGGRLIVVPPGANKDIKYLKSTIKKYRIGVVGFTPSLLNIFLQKTSPNDCDSLKHIVCGGEKLEPSTKDLFFKKIPKVNLLRFYGLTEAGMALYLNYKNKNDPRSLGFPTYMNVYVLNEKLKLMPPDEIGEIFISGDGVANGYFNNKSLTLDRFLPDPFNPGKVMFRTKDRALKKKTGEFIYLDRMDRMVKIRGVRVELGEIESNIQKIKEIGQACALTLKQNTGQEKLFCFYSIKKDEKFILPQDLFSSLQKKLPAPMLPHKFINIKEFPLHPNGKIDIQQMRKMAQSEITENKIINSALNKIERIVCQALNIDTVKSTDRFYSDLGGDSLAAMEIMAGISDRFEKDIPFNIFSEDPTIADILSKLPSETYLEKNVIKESGSKFNPFPLSGNQVNFLNIQPLSHKISLKIIGNFDIQIFEKAINKFVEANPIVLAKVFDSENIPYQRIQDQHIDFIELIKLEGSHSDRISATYILSKKFFKSNTYQTYPFRILIIEISKNEYFLNLLFNILYFDGHSIKIFFEEISSAYSKVQLGKPINIKKKTGFNDYVFWENSTFKENEFLRNCINPLPKMLNKSKANNFESIDSHDKPNFQADSWFSSVKPETTNILEDLSQKHGTSFNRILIGVLALSICNLLNKNLIPIDIMTSNRCLGGMQNMIGPLSTRATVVYNFSEKKNISVIKEIKRATQHLLNQQPPFELVRRTLGDEQMLKSRVLVSEFNNNTDSLNLINTDITRLSLNNHDSQTHTIDLLTELIIRFSLNNGTLNLYYFFRDRNNMKQKVLELFRNFEISALWLSREE